MYVENQSINKNYCKNSTFSISYELWASSISIDSCQLADYEYKQTKFDEKY